MTYVATDVRSRIGALVARLRAMVDGPALAAEPAAPPRYWLQDQPPDLDAEGGDAFAVSAMVDRLASLVMASPAPFTLSLSGSWGIGKSTIAETLIKRVRKKSDAMKACLVDAWGEDIEHLRRTLAIAVGAELLGGEEHRDEVAERIDRPVGLTRSVSKPKGEFVLPETLKSVPRNLQQVLVTITGIEAVILAVLLLAGSEQLKFAIPIITGALGATIAAAITKTDILFRVENTTETKAPAAESVHMARAFAAAVTGSEGGSSTERVLVVIDNLDRLPGKDALRALAEIRSLVEIKGSRCVFLIPVDRAAFATHIKSALTNDISAKDYLDKFFNLDILLTQPEQLDVRDWATKQARPLFGKEVSDEELAAAVQAVAAMAGGSPRAVKRIINGVSTRLQMLDPSVSPRPTLAQLALIEGLIVRFPELVTWLEAEPRNFGDLRIALSESSVQDQDKALATIPLLGKERRDALRTVLVRNADIAMPPGLIRLVMALREDRAWKDIPDPQAIREALGNGEPEAYNAALDEIDADLRPIGIERSVAWINRSVPAFPRDAMTNLIAIAEKIGDYPEWANRLRPTAARVVLLADPANRNRTTEALARYLLDPAHPRSAELASAYAGLVAPSEDEGEERTVAPGALLALRMSSGDIPANQLGPVRTKLADYSDDDLTFAWEPEVDLTLTTGAVAAGYAKRLADHDMRESMDASTDRVIRRLTAFVAIGGKEPTLATVATAATTQLGATTGNLMPADLEYLSCLPGILVGTTGAEIDALASALASSTRGVRGDLLIIAMNLETSVAVRATLAAAAESWLALPTVNAAEVRSLLDLHGSALMDEGVNFVTALATQWVNRGEPAFASLAVELIPETAPEAMMLALASGAAGDTYPVRVAEAVSLIGTDTGGHLTALVAQVADWASSTGTPPTLTALAPALVALQVAGGDCSPIYEAMQKRLATAPLTAAELLLMVQVVTAWDGEGVSVPATLAETLTGRMVSVAVADPNAAMWSARKTNGKEPARILMVAAIKDATVPVGKVVAAAHASYGVFRHHDAIGAALVARAAVTQEESEARQLLQEAIRWNRPRDRSEFDANLTTIGTAMPGLDDLVTELRKQ